MPSDILDCGLEPYCPQTLAHFIEQVIRTRTIVRGLRVEIIDDEVFVTGRTTTYYAKQLATHAALEACDQRALTNDIEVT
jgi:hypothetical protein